MSLTFLDWYWLLAIRMSRSIMPFFYCIIYTNYAKLKKLAPKHIFHKNLDICRKDITNISIILRFQGFWRYLNIIALTFVKFNNVFYAFMSMVHAKICENIQIWPTMIISMQRMTNSIKRQLCLRFWNQSKRICWYWEKF